MIEHDQNYNTVESEPANLTENNIIAYSVH